MQDKMNLTFMRKLSADRNSPDASSSQMSSVHDDDSVSVISGETSFAGSSAGQSRSGKSKQNAVDVIWQQVFEPSLEYARVSSNPISYARHPLTGLAELRQYRPHAKHPESAFHSQHD